MLAAEALSQEALTFTGLNIESLEHTVLATIVNAKVADLPKIKALATSLKVQSNHEHNQAHMGLKDSLSLPGRRFILECKRASPSLGDINLNLDIKTQVNLYETRAAAISVLTEEHFFKGSYEVLSQVRGLTKLPVLCKDFVICKEQIEIAAALGANAILLMLSVLTQERFLELYALAQSLGLDVLSEVSTKEEAQFAIAHKLPIVGINHRNLRTLQIDLQRTHKLAPLFKNNSETILVCESGINDHSAIEYLAPQRCFLIGSALCSLEQGTKQEQIAQSATFMDRLLYGLNKVCGNNTAQGIEAAIRNHVAFSGLIFVKKSPRYISKEDAAKLIGPYRSKIKFCGVFLDQPLNEVVDIVNSLDLPVVQLHGSENVAYMHKLKAICPKLKIIKAFNLDAQKVADESYLEDMRQAQANADYLLLDSSAPGSGKRCDLDLIPDFIERKRTILAGGLSHLNLPEVKASLASKVTTYLRSECSQISHYSSPITEHLCPITDQPHKIFFAGFDLNSGLESAPGIKDAALIDAAFTTLD